MSGCQSCLTPKRFRQVVLEKKGPIYLENIAIFPLYFAMVYWHYLTIPKLELF